jgi:hypothetical protein
MQKSKISCTMGHTSLYPGKTAARAWWMNRLPIKKDVITISHGALDCLSFRGHRGRILVVDTDPGVIERTKHLRGHGQGARYPNLNLLSPVQAPINAAFAAYAIKLGLRDCAAVDLDFACGVKEAWFNSDEVFRIAALGAFKGMLLLTFRNGRNDGFGNNATQKRINWLYAMARARGVSSKVEVTHQKYRSDWIGRFAEGKLGSSMCIVKFQF